ncbi:MAG: DUF1552 domain-containing protein [Alphaproteobacteria bacterium]|nr:DUF1552 domain-containing protein [Alphaproteobacteria bacterium]
MSVLLPSNKSRRQMLRSMMGGGVVSLTLPFLDCLLNANGTALASGAPIPTRFGTWYWGMGHTPDRAVKPKTATGPGIEFLDETKALIPHKDKLNYFGNFNMPLDGRSNYTHFTGWVANRTGSAPEAGGDIPAPTLDLLIADEIGKGTRFRTLDVSSVGISRENYSARNTYNRAAAEVDPVALYDRIYGPEFADPNKADFKPDPEVQLRKSVLSAFTEETKDYMKTLGAADKQRMDQYYTSIREIENQLALQLTKPEPNEACVVPTRPGELGSQAVAKVREMDSVVETHKVMTKILAMAVACNQTNVFNMVFTDNFANVRRVGETYTHHLLTHEEVVDAEKGYQPLTYWFNEKSMEGMATFIDIIDSIPEGEGTLLDNCLIFASTETNYARLHTIDGVPVYLIGGAGGRMKQGMYVVGGGDPITRIGLTTMQIMGVPVQTWGTKSLQTSKPVSEILV